ncbi:MAG: prenyltransferase/squalene oxidase repeat-containing protein [Pirellula sp.]
MKSRAKPTSTRKGNLLWPLDLALTLLGGLVLFLVLRLLDFSDPNPLKNAWTYVLGVPTVLVAVSMLTHVLSNETVERSIQIGFLLSVSLHLILAFAAVNVVLFGGFWNSVQPQSKTDVLRNDKQSPKYLQASVPSAESAKREYLKPPKEPQQKPTETDSDTPREKLAAEVSLVDSKVSVETKIAERTFPEEKKQESITQPTIASSAMKLDRPKISTLQDVSQNTIELPQLPELNRSELGDLAANDTAIDQSPRQQKSTDSIAVPESLLTPTISSKPNTDRNQLQSSAQPSTLNQEIDKTLNQQQRDIETSRLSRQPSRQIANSSTMLPSFKSSVPVPKLEKPNDTQSPSSDLTNFANLLDRGERASLSRGSPSNDTSTLSSVIGPQMETKPRTQSSEGIAKSRSAIEWKMDERLDYLSERSMQSNNPRVEFSKNQETPRLGGGTSSGASSNGPIASSQVPLDEVLGNASAKSSIADGKSPSVADISSEDRVLERNQTRGAGAMAARGSPSIEIPAIAPSELAGPRTDFRTRGLGMRPVETSIPDLRVSDFTPERLKRPDLSGPQSLSASVPIPAPAFSQRLKRIEEREGEATSQLGPLGPQTELAIERGLQFLAKYQRSDGSWHLEDFGEQVRMRSPTAATALALLSFQGAGYTHQQFKYEGVCKGALGWLIQQQQPNGDLYVRTDTASNANAWLYSHSMATLALCEAYGMTQDEAIRGAAQRAIDFLAEAQDPVGGGWRYSPRIGSDTSVTGWVMMALKSAELSGLNVPTKTYDGIQKWIENSQSKDAPYLYRYNWLANTPSTEHGRIPTPVMTSVGLLIRLYTGWKRDNEQMQKGVAWLLERLPAEGTRQSPSRDTYYWYYATQVVFHAGGESWKRWYGALYPILIRTQVESGDYLGSWDPGGTVPDAWGAFGGRLYVTTLNLLSLEVYYRHLPLYDATAD